MADKGNFYKYMDSVYVDTYCHNAIPGDANGSGACNGNDVVYLTNFLKGGPHPPDSCMCGETFLYHAADANGSCSVNGNDLTYLVNYLKGGPAPRFCATCPNFGLLVEKREISAIKNEDVGK